MHKNLNYVLNQNVSVTKQARFATFAISMLDNIIFAYCSSINEAKSKYEWMNEKLYLSVHVFSCKLMEDTMIAAIDHKHSNSCPFLMFSSVAEKNWPFS